MRIREKTGSVFGHLLFRHRLSDVRLVSFLSAIVIYGLAGTPTPSSFGWVEVSVFVLLFVSIDATGWKNIVSECFQPGTFRLYAVFVIFGLTLPLLIGAMAGYDASLIVRDSIAFGFLALPILVLPLFKNQLSRIAWFTALYVLFGVLFSLRDLGGMGGGDKLDYLANSPAVLFSALLLFGYGFMAFCQRFSMRALLIMVICFAVLSIPVMAMVETQQRATLGLLAFGACLIGGYAAWLFPKRVFCVLLMLLPFGFVFASDISHVVQTLLTKSDLVGLNAREDEWQAVWETMSGSNFNLVFGLGWGAEFYSPAVADLEVTYTHSLLSYMLLKAGIIGFVITTLVVGLLSWKLFHLWPVFPVLSLALFFPFLIDVFLYASYKSLDFGLLLCLILALISYARISHGENRSDVEAFDAFRYV